MNSLLQRAYLASVVALALAACDGSTAPTQSTPPATPNAVATTGAPSDAPQTTSLPSERLNHLVDDLLRAQYPEGFDAEHQCWKATYGDGEAAMAYCMRPLPPSAVLEEGRQIIYVATASAADIEGNAAYRYGAVDPGMFDAFRLSVAPNGKATVTASRKGMDFGSAGDCGCVNADLVALGTNVHGWVFSSGGTAQGTTTATHSLVAPVGNTFMDVGGIPQYVEDDQDVEYRIAIGSEKAENGWYPVTVTKYRKNERLDSRVLRFDAGAKRYSMPESF